MFDIPGMHPTGPRKLPTILPRAAVTHPAAPGRTWRAEPTQEAGWAPRSEAEQWWHYSRGCARALIAGQMPPTVEVYGPVLEPGEAALLTARAGYSRCCGSDARYSPLPMVVAGRPAVMFGVLAAQGLINHRRKVAVERNAAVQWRFHETSNLIVTTERLLCSTLPHGQVSFWYGACSEFYPDLQNWTVTLGFDSTYPVRLSGPATPALSLWCAYGVLGDAWSEDPRLAALLA